MASAQPASSGVFPPEAIASLNRAFAAAVSALPQDADPERRFDLALQVMRLACNGETDEQRLCSLAVATVLGREHVLKASAQPSSPIAG